LEVDQISTWNLIEHVNAILGLVDKSLSPVIFPYFNALQFCCLTYLGRVHLFAADGARGRDSGTVRTGLGESPGVGGVADLASFIAS
jgi:hypothetical protein